MAKNTKKVSKKTKAPNGEQKVEEVKQAPPAIEGIVHVPMSTSDLITLANLLSTCTQTFEKLANQAMEQNDEVTFNILAARYKLSNHFAIKMAEYTKIGEPLSRDYH